VGVRGKQTHLAAFLGPSLRIVSFSSNNFTLAKLSKVNDGTN